MPHVHNDSFLWLYTRNKYSSTGPYPATTTGLRFESTGGNAFSISSRSVTSFPACFCVLLQRPCVHYTELFVGFVGRSLTKPAQIVDIFSSIIGVFFTRLSSYSQRQVSFPLPFSLFLPAHPHRTIRAVFGSVGLRSEHGPAYGAAFHLVPALADLGVQGRVQREDGGLKPPA